MTIKPVKTIWRSNKDVDQPESTPNKKLLAVASKYLSIGSLKKEFEKYSQKGNPACVQSKRYQVQQLLLRVEKRWFRF